MERRLYRDTANGKIGGVCAGLAEYLGLETWIVRIIAVSGFLLGFGFFATVAYIAAVLMIEKKPATLHTQYGHDLHVKKTPWQQGKSAPLVLSELDQKLNQLERKVNAVESYVTSREFELNRQFRQL